MSQLYVLDLIRVTVTPADDETRSGIDIEGAYSRPFTVQRDWSGPVGYYFEQIVVKQDDQVVYESEPRQIFVRGLQSRTSYTDTIEQRIRLKPGPCHVSFLIGGTMMAYTEIQASTLSPAGA